MEGVDTKPFEEKVEEKMDKNHITFSGKSFKDVDHFVNEDKQHLFRKTWMPKCEPKALLMILHGYSLHNGYFAEIAEAAVKLGMLVFAHDNVGHGESEGDRCDVTGYEVYIRDALQHIEIMKEKYPHLPLYLFGYSKGGGLAVILAGENPDLFNGLILCAPLIEADSLPTGAKLFLMKSASIFLPQLEVREFLPEMLTRNLEEVKKYKNDPLIYHGKIKLRMMVQLRRICERAQEILSEISMPLLVLHADKDGLCNFSGSENLMRDAKSEDKTLKVYEGAFHQLFNEIDDVPDRFFNDMKEWIHERLSE